MSGVVLLGVLSLATDSTQAPPPPPPTRENVQQARVEARGPAYEAVGWWSQWQAADEVPGGRGPSVVLGTEWDTKNVMACLEVSGRWVPAGGDGACPGGLPAPPPLSPGGR